MLPLGVLFDMDGTLTDTEKLWFQAETELIAELGGDWQPGDERELIGLNLHDASALLVNRLKLDISPEDFGRILTDRVTELGRRHGMPWRPGAYELLDLLRNLDIPSVLVTASMRRFAQLTLGQAPVGSLEFAVTGEDVVRGKPDPEAYQRAASLIGVEPRDCVAFEDSVHGLNSARRAGAIAVGVPLNVDISDVPGVILIDSLEQVDEDFLRALMR
ncbi:HAD superfamily hydrolase (TIGR01509 family) [Trueperella bonasi]|uniref:HAD superfamily hydrolase (TIGR01509 family) n=1 Tax=Trueperella bonasi TaxID=312286 RepID=A0ABT9NDP9_9ACTO|nr:HAD family phosphatase [Trueperella bonasi]MDP9805522.1 HAD superfamily hydrolase (TIGR01509 family) [Trueperella bonasi]